MWADYKAGLFVCRNQSLIFSMILVTAPTFHQKQYLDLSGLTRVFLSKKFGDFSYRRIVVVELIFEKSNSFWNLSPK
jgi:hypothetical protein